MPEKYNKKSKKLDAFYVPKTVKFKEIRCILCPKLWDNLSSLNERNCMFSMDVRIIKAKCHRDNN
jgi:hypothetical protein